MLMKAHFYGIIQSLKYKQMNIFTKSGRKPDFNLISSLRVLFDRRMRQRLKVLWLIKLIK